MRTNGNPVKQRKLELSEHHFSDSSIIVPNPEIGGCADMRSESMSQRLVIHPETWESGSLFTLDSAEMPKLPMMHPLTLSGYRDA